MFTHIAVLYLPLEPCKSVDEFHKNDDPVRKN